MSGENRPLKTEQSFDESNVQGDSTHRGWIQNVTNEVNS